MLPVQPTELGSLSFDLIYYTVDVRIIFIQDGNILGGKMSVQTDSGRDNCPIAHQVIKMHSEDLRSF